MERGRTFGNDPRRGRKGGSAIPGYGRGAQASVNHDLDGDGTNDIVLADDSSLWAFDANLAPIVSLRLGEGVFMPWSAGNLDGRPGDEIVLFVANYGLVALGRGGEPPARRAEMR